MRKKKLDKIRDTGILNIKFTGKIILSSLCLVACLSSLSFGTWAWFTDTATMNAIIQVANYDIIAQVKSDTDTVRLSKSTFLEYNLNSPKTYTVILTANGTATTGFCEITVDGKTYYTEPISTKDGENTFTFTIVSFTDGKIDFNPRWGSHSKDDTIKNGDVITIGDETQMSEDITINILNQSPTIEESAVETLKPETDSTEESTGEELKPETDRIEESTGEELKPETDSVEESTVETVTLGTDSIEESPKKDSIISE